MAGRVHLGTEGEAAAADVLAAWEVGSGFECCAVVSEYPAALAELKAQLQEKSERLYTLEPDARFREDGKLSSKWSRYSGACFITVQENEPHPQTSQDVVPYRLSPLCLIDCVRLLP